MEFLDHSFQNAMVMVLLMLKSVSLLQVQVVPWQTFDLSTVAEPPGMEYAVPGKEEKQTFYYNFCRGTTSHGTNETSFDYACRGGVSAVCQTTEEIVRDGLAYPCGTVQNVVARHNSARRTTLLE